MATADLDGDGRQDLAILNGEDNSYEILLGNGDGTFQAPVAYSVGATPGLIAVADFNEDGKLDLAILYTAPSKSAFYLEMATVRSRQAGPLLREIFRATSR